MGGGVIAVLSILGVLALGGIGFGVYMATKKTDDPPPAAPAPTDPGTTVVNIPGLPSGFAIPSGLPIPLTAPPATTTVPPYVPPATHTATATATTTVPPVPTTTTTTPIHIGGAGAPPIAAPPIATSPPGGRPPGPITIHH